MLAALFPHAWCHSRPAGELTGGRAGRKEGRKVPAVFPPALRSHPATGRFEWRSAGCSPELVPLHSRPRFFPRPHARVTTTAPTQ